LIRSKGELSSVTEGNAHTNSDSIMECAHELTLRREALPSIRCTCVCVCEGKRARERERESVSERERKREERLLFSKVSPTLNHERDTCR